jgi:hypothetical protein
MAWFGGFLFLLVSVAAGLLIVLSYAVVPQGKPLPAIYTLLSFNDRPLIQPGAVLREQVEYLCGDSEIAYQGPMPRFIPGLEREQLSKKYPAEDGWMIDFQDPDMVVVSRPRDEFCPGHQMYRHLGIYDGKVAVFEGPLGFNGRMLRVEENLPVNILPPTLQVKLKQAENYHEQPPETRVVLQKELEFTDENALNVMLENLDELEPGLDIDSM